MKMKKITYISLFLTFLLLGSKITLSADQSSEEAIYKLLFSEFHGGNNIQFYLVDTTENYWFLNNPYKKEDWQEHLERMGNIPIELVKKIYHINKEREKVKWSSAKIKPTFLPEKYLNRGNRKKDESLCLVEAGNGNVGVRHSKTKKEFRSYYSVSKVAFLKGKNIAILKYSKHCAPLSGAGEAFAVFKFNGEKWELTSGRLLWIS